MDKPELPEFAGIVLAGGASSRMGQDKSRLPMGETDLLGHAVARMEGAGASPVIVSGDQPRHDCVPDELPGLGPLGGIHSVLRARPGLHGRMLLIRAVDTPGLDSEALRALILRAAEFGPGAHYEEHPLPLAVLASEALTEALETLLAGQGPTSVQRLIRLLGIRSVPSDGVNLSNLNTPEEWRRFQSAAG